MSQHTAEVDTKQQMQEVTLLYHKGRWDGLAWTFPDFASARYHPFLSSVRQRLMDSQRKERSA